MEKFIIIGIVILVTYQIYSTDKNVAKLLNEIDGLKCILDPTNQTSFNWCELY